MTRFLDTNILLYSIAADASDRAKGEIAEAVLWSSDCVLSVQVLNEFVWQMTRGRGRIPRNEVFQFVERWRRFPVVPLDLPLFDLAAEIARETNYTWWDCLIVAAAVSAGCGELLSEDLDHGRIIHGVRITNPFRALA